MATTRTQSKSPIEEGRDRLTSAVKKLRRTAEQRRKALERRADRLRSELRKNPVVKRAEKQAQELEKRAEKLRGELRNTPAVKRAEALRKDAEKAIESGVETLLGNLRIASASEVSRLERRLAAIDRKLNALEKRGTAAA
jgi:hypothetical protein